MTSLKKVLQFNLKYFTINIVCEMQLFVLFSLVYKPASYNTVQPSCHFDIHKIAYSRYVKMKLPSEFYCP